VNIVGNFFGVIATITSFVGLFPQIYKTYKTKSAHDLSMIMLLNYLICSFAWIIYGSYTNSTFVIYSNVIGLISSIISILQKKYYDSL
jgi:MtN3 and saliva related transmembrane protein